MATAAVQDVVRVQHEENGRVWLIQLYRPAQRNAVNRDTAAVLANAFIDFEKDPTACVAILYGTSEAFCAGADLKALSRVNEPEESGASSSSPKNNNNTNALIPVAVDVQAQTAVPVLDTTAPLGITRLLLSKPVIAAISGYCVAGGLEIACWADLRVADTSAVFGVFCRRFGVPLIDGGTYRLPQLIGRSRAMDMILTGRPVTAAEAFAMGLVNRLVAPDQLLEESRKLARLLCSFPQQCMRADRASVLLGAAHYATSPAFSALSSEFVRGIHVIQTESISGASAFASGQGRHGQFGPTAAKL